MDSAVLNSPRGGRWVIVPFLALGAAAIVFAGLFSAATARSASYHSAWLVAYLVLIVGLAQVALGIGQWWLASAKLGVATAIAQLAFFNLGNAGVIIGTLLAAPFWVDAGSVGILVALALFAWTVRAPKHRGLALWGYWALVVLLTASVLIGIYFAHS